MQWKKIDAYYYVSDNGQYTVCKISAGEKTLYEAWHKKVFIHSSENHKDAFSAAEEHAKNYSSKRNSGDTQNPNNSLPEI